MLPIADVSRIIDMLITLEYFDITSNPLDWSHTLQSLPLNEISNVTEISISELTLFANQSVFCVVDEVAKNSTADLFVLGASIFDSCFIASIAPLTCSQSDTNAMYRGFILCIAIALVLILSLFGYKRKSCLASVCYGRPAPVVPLNMLDSYENRKGFALAFGLTVSSCISILLGDYKEIVGTSASETVSTFPSYVGSFVLYVFAIAISMLSYPFFICQSIPNRLFGGIIGLVYGLIWFALEISKWVIIIDTCFEYYKSIGVGIRNDFNWRIIICNFVNVSRKSIRVFSLIVDIPKFICLILLTVKFAYMIYLAIKTRQKRKTAGYSASMLSYKSDYDWHESYIHTYVKQLLSKQKQNDDEDDLTFQQKLRAKLYVVKPGFKYSTRIVASYVVSTCAVYIITLVIVAYGYVIFVELWDDIFSSDVVDFIMETTGLSLTDVKDYGYCAQSSWWLAATTGIIFYILVLCNSLTWYRRHVIMLRRGERSFLPNSVKKGTLSAPTLMTSSMKFAGFQVGYCVWGTIITNVLAFVTFFIISTQIILPIKTHRVSTLLSLLVNVWPAILVAIFMALLQWLLASFCFLIDRDTLAVNNRRAYHIASYFLLYFNIFLGLASCLLRIIFGVIFGVLFLQRLQKSSLPRSYERRDPGFLSYLGYILLEHQQANPTLQCFVRLLLESQGKQFCDDCDENSTKKITVNPILEFGLEDQNECITKQDLSRKRAKTRWFLFVTLIQNPSLKTQRKRYLEQSKKLTKTQNLIGNAFNALSGVTSPDSLKSKVV